MTKSRRRSTKKVDNKDNEGVMRLIDVVLSLVDFNKDDLCIKV